MSTFKLHDQRSAPEASQPLLEDSAPSLGRITGLPVS